VGLNPYFILAGKCENHIFSRKYDSGRTKDSAAGIFFLDLGQPISVAEQHHFEAASVPGKNFDAAPAAPAPAPTLLYSKAKFLK
jgi:hypothetical protein